MPPQVAVVCAVAAFAFLACALVARAYAVLESLRRPSRPRASAEPAPADRAVVLFAQSTADSRGSRAPPAASV